ncbi:MAG: GntR family transcriptional regulator [Victivallaceae bacterium]
MKSNLSKRRRLEMWLREELKNGAYPPHHRFFSQAKLKELHQVSQATVTEALQTLAAEGLLYFRPGSGTYVSPPRRVYQMLVVAEYGRENFELNAFLCAVEKSPAAGQYRIIPIEEGEFCRNVAHFEIIYPQTVAVIFFRRATLFTETAKLVERAGAFAVFYGSSTFREQVGLRNAYYYDEHEVVRMALARLAAAGRRKIGCCTLDTEIFLSRREHWRKLLGEFNLEYQPRRDFVAADNEELYRLLKSLRREELDCDGLFCGFAFSGMVAAQALLAVGVRVPEDVALVTVGDFSAEFMRCIHPRPGSVAIDHPGDGVKLIGMLDAAMGSKPAGLALSGNSPLVFQPGDPAI